jgi:tRNA-dihydrouridine synthase A
MDKYTNNKFCTAPMLDLSDDHCRFFWRSLSKRAMLYTEMVTTGAIIYGKKDYLAYNESENPLALQLGGCNPEDLAFCAKKAEKYNYQEINLNVGCPSDRVQNGGFGASLMAQPQLVADCIKAMKDAVSVPVSVKCRIGIDELDSYEYLTQFIGTVEQTGCDLFIIHARKAWLQGLSPRENRDIPPLNMKLYIRLKRISLILML